MFSLLSGQYYALKGKLVKTGLLFICNTCLNFAAFDYFVGSYFVENTEINGFVSPSLITDLLKQSPGDFALYFLAHT